MKTYITYGAINTIIGALLSLALYFTGFQTEKIAIGQHFQWLSLAIFVAVLFFGMRDVREQKPNKAITYGGALGAAVMIALFSGLFSAVYNYIHFTYINPEFSQYMLELSRSNLEAKNVPDAQIEQAISMQSKFMTPVAMAISGTIGVLFMGCLIGLVLAIFVKKAAPKDEIKAS